MGLPWRSFVRVPVLIAVVLAMIVAACGDDTDDSSDAVDTGPETAVAPSVNVA